MNVLGEQIGAAPDTITAAITQDAMPAGASDHFYVEPAGPAQFEPSRPADVVLTTGGHTQVGFSVPYEGAYYGVSAWRHFADGSKEAWDVPPLQQLPYQARWYQSTRYFTTIETYVHPLTAGHAFTEHELGHEWQEDFAQGLRFWCEEYGAVNHSIHRMSNDPTSVDVPEVTYYGVEDTELPVPEGWTDEVFHADDYTYDYTYPSHTLSVPESTGVGGRVYRGKNLDWEGNDASTMKSIGAGMVPVLGLKMDSDWEMERRIFSWDDPFDLYDFDPASTHLVAFISETWYVLDLGALQPDNKWHVQKVRYSAATKTFDVWVDGKLVRNDWFPAVYDKPPPLLPVKTWLYIGSNIVDWYRFRGEIPYYAACDSQEFRRWPGFGDTFGLLWGAESYWEDPNNVYGQRDAETGSYDGFGGIGPMSATADPKLMYPVSVAHGYGYPLSPLTIATGDWSALSPRFAAQEWRSLRYLGRQKNGTMTVKVVDADTNEVLVTHSGATSTMGFHDIDLSGIDPSTVLRVLVEGGNTTTAHDQASRFAALEIDADPLDPPPIPYDLADKFVWRTANGSVRTATQAAATASGVPTASGGLSVPLLVAAHAEPESEEAIASGAVYALIGCGAHVVAVPVMSGRVSALLAARAHATTEASPVTPLGPYTLTLSSPDPPRLTLTGD